MCHKALIDDAHNEILMPIVLVRVPSHRIIQVQSEFLYRIDQVNP
jgi:hypothetical protein